MELRKATRQKAKLRLGISGPSGSGKTYSALLLASGFAPWDKVALIDTENGRGDLYAHLGEYNIITLGAPFTPERYIEAIRACEAAGIEVIVIDSISHEWEGKGGILEMNDLIAQTKFKGNTWAAWSHTTPRHQAFVQAIIQSSCHIITTVRSKTETVNEGGKIKKLGMKAIQREGFDYELTVNFNLDRDSHTVMVDKDNTELFEGNDPFVITAKTGKLLKKWCEEGVEPVKEVQESPKTPSTAPLDLTERPHLKKLRAALQKFGAKTVGEGLSILNEKAGLTLTQFPSSEEDAAKAYAALLNGELKSPSLQS